MPLSRIMFSLCKASLRQRVGRLMGDGRVSLYFDIGIHPPLTEMLVEFSHIDSDPEPSSPSDSPYTNSITPSSSSSFIPSPQSWACPLVHLSFHNTINNQLDITISSDELSRTVLWRLSLCAVDSNSTPRNTPRGAGVGGREYGFTWVVKIIDGFERIYKKSFTDPQTAPRQIPLTTTPPSHLHLSFLPPSPITSSSTSHVNANAVNANGEKANGANRTDIYVMKLEEMALSAGKMLVALEDGQRRVVESVICLTGVSL